MWRWLVLGFWLMGTPSFGQNASLIYTDEDGHSQKTRLLTQADKSVREFFAGSYGQSIDGPVVLIGTSTSDSLNGQLMTALEDLGRRQRTSPIDVEKLCQNKTIGAAANRPYIVMCWKEPEEYTDWWLVSFMPKLAPVLAHEFTHQLQYHLANDDPARFISGTKELLFGPSWMIEGSAEVFEYLYAVQTQGKDVGNDAAQNLFNMQSPARRSRLTLTQLTPTGSTKGRGAYGTARFAAYLLAQRNGPDALFEYFKVLGQTKDRDLAFSQVFGLSFETFEADFERVRRDFSAAKEYVAGGT
jgi:hypothetical protein